MKIAKAFVGTFGFFAGFVAASLAFALLATRFRVDAFRMYLVDPVPPPGGYRSTLEVPPSTWPLIVILLGGVLGASVGLAMMRLLTGALTRARGRTERQSCRAR